MYHHVKYFNSILISALVAGEGPPTFLDHAHTFQVLFCQLLLQFSFQITKSQFYLIILYFWTEVCAKPKFYLYSLENTYCYLQEHTGRIVGTGAIGILLGNSSIQIQRQYRFTTLLHQCSPATSNSGHLKYIYIFKKTLVLLDSHSFQSSLYLLLSIIQISDPKRSLHFLREGCFLMMSWWSLYQSAK